MTEMRRIRREKELSQKELAERAGVAPSVVYSAEAGRHLPRYENIEKLAHVLGVEVADILPKDHASASDYVNKRGGISQSRTGRAHVDPITGSSSVKVTVDRALLGALLHAVESDSITADEAERLLVGAG
jgi:DNA-binding XRE family transcriptional regulator